MRNWERRNIGSKVKLTCLKAVEAIGTRASTMASNAKQRVAEINLETRRQDILSQFTLLAYDLWQNGTQLPEPLDAMLKELAELDERLSVLRAQRYVITEEDGGVHEEVDAAADGEAAESPDEALLSDGPEPEASPEEPEAEASPDEPEAQASPEEPEAQASPEEPEAQASPEEPEARDANEPGDSPIPAV